MHPNAPRPTDQHVTPVGITVIPILIAIAIAVTGLLIVRKFSTDRPSQCDELTEVFDVLKQSTPGSDVRGFGDSTRVAC